MAIFITGDWIETDNQYFKILDFWQDRVLFYGADWDFKNNLNDYNKVTEPWKIMLLNLGRKTPEFKPGDVLVTYQDLYLARYHDHDDIVLLFEENLVIRFCPEEHSIEV